jgi:hypothetical protein
MCFRDLCCGSKEEKKYKNGLFHSNFHMKTGPKSMYPVKKPSWVGRYIPIILTLEKLRQVNQLM